MALTNALTVDGGTPTTYGTYAAFLTGLVTIANATPTSKSSPTLIVTLSDGTSTLYMKMQRSDLWLTDLSNDGTTWVKVPANMANYPSSDFELGAKVLSKAVTECAAWAKNKGTGTEITASLYNLIFFTSEAARFNAVGKAADKMLSGYKTLSFKDMKVLLNNWKVLRPTDGPIFGINPSPTGIATYKVKAPLDQLAAV